MLLIAATNNENERLRVIDVLLLLEVDHGALVRSWEGIFSLSRVAPRHWSRAVVGAPIGFKQAGR